MTREWYVSYGWGDDRTPEGRKREAVVDQLCAAATARGIIILRDKEQLRPGQSIAAFMRRIGTGDRIFVILSEKYLCSPYCMFELSEIWRTSQQEGDAFRQRVRIYVVDGVQVWRPVDWAHWAVHWRKEYDALDAIARQHGAAILGEQGHRRLMQMQRFYTQVADILGTLSDIVQPRSFEELQSYGFDGAESDQVASPPSWADDAGRDEHGAWAGFGIVGKGGTRVTQRLRWIPPGRFQMGSPPGEEGRDNDEGPQHEVTLAEGFWLFDTPCTQALWEAVVGDNPSRFKSQTRPVEQVSFKDVQSFLDKLNAQVPGLDLGLPSEAQWEYACRAGTDTATYGGDMRIIGENNAPLLDAIAWYGGNSGVGFELDNGYDSNGWREKQYAHTRAGTRPVARKAANPWGLYDMLGNVWEWCGDHWHDSYTGAPADGSAWISEDQGAASRVIRGGSWGGLARLVRAASRDRFDPAYRNGRLGFRCARVQVAK